MNNLQNYKKQVILAIIFLLVFLPIFNIKAGSVIDILNIKAKALDGRTAQVEWSTSEITTGKIIFGEEKDYMPYYIIDGNKPSKYHQIKIGNLKSKTTYYYKIIAISGNQEVKSYVKSFVTEEYKEEIKPEIKNLKVAYISGTAAVLTWESSEASNSVVLYGSDKKYKSKAEDKKYTKTHLVILKNLKPNKIYYARAYSTDKSGNKSEYLFKQFTTLETKTVDAEDLLFSHLRPSGPNDSQITPNSIKVTFKTNHFAKGTITISKNKKSLGSKNIKYASEASAEFIGLNANTKYNIAISMTDIFGKKKSASLDITTTKIYYDALIPQLETDKEEEVIVLGREFSFYTSAAALYKSSDSPKVYSIINNKKHCISSPQSFLEYGYSWNKIKTVNRNTLSSYQRVRLVKSPERSDVYYLHENQNGDILKIRIPSPTVFNSYKSNSWGDIVKITQYDLDSYKEIKLIKTADSQDIYYLDNGYKKYVSVDVFKAKGFSYNDILTVSKTHFDSYKSASDLK